MLSLYSCQRDDLFGIIASPLDPPDFSVQPGVFRFPVNFELSAQDNGTKIFYTTDGTVPQVVNLQNQGFVSANASTSMTMNQVSFTVTVPGTSMRIRAFSALDYQSSKYSREVDATFSYFPPKLYAVDGTANSGRVWSSDNSGVTWSIVSSSIPNDGSTNPPVCAIASSNDGANLVAVAGSDWPYQGNIYTSSNGGGTWTIQVSAGDRAWMDVASSADGRNLAAVVWESQVIFHSADYGATWSASQSMSSSNYWTHIVSSSTGQYLAAVNPDDSEGVWFSTDYGDSTWITHISNPGPPVLVPTAVALSADGSILIAGGDNSNASSGVGSPLSRSADSGVDWTPLPFSPTGFWSSIAMSDDGTKIVATETNGYVYVSTDSGNSWVTRITDASRAWSKVVCSSDGTIQMAAAHTDSVYISFDSGMTWNQTGSGSKNWIGLAMSRN